MYGSQPKVKFHLNRHQLQEDAATFTKYTERIHGSTNTADALRTAITMFTMDNGDRLDVRNLIVLVTDSGSDMKTDTLRVAMEAKRLGIQIVVLALGQSQMLDVDEVTAIASYPAQANLISAPDFTQLRHHVKPLTHLLCDSEYTLILHLVWRK